MKFDKAIKNIPGTDLLYTTKKKKSKKKVLPNLGKNSTGLTDKSGTSAQ